jgi:GNAT superfamily N-acetyltransferase
MAPTDELPIRVLGADAVAEAFALTVEVGWNQTAEDWAFSIAHGTVYGVRDGSGRLIATAAMLPYPGNRSGKPRVAWVSLVIVTESHRGRGLGTRLLRQCIATLRAGSLTGLLDATPAGQKVYTPLGFKPVLGLQRWQGEGSDAVDTDARVRLLAAAAMDKIAALDALAFGAQRRTLLADVSGRAGTHGFELVDGSGYALVRLGRVASHLGPVVASNAHDATALIGAAAAAMRGPIFIDVPETQAEIAGWLGAHGFTVQRPLLRMALGRGVPRGDPAHVFASAGPEYG